MEIVLLRHGKPNVQTSIRLSAAELPAWVVDYNDAGLDPAYAPPESSLQLPEKSTFVVCSDLRRSWESAHALGVETIGVCEATFREVELPFASWRFPRLPVSAWAVIFRLIWIAGYFSNDKSLQPSRQRARQCAERLAEWAKMHDRVLFVGHGALNWLIARDLKRMGWSGAKRSPRNYWEFSVYRYEET